MPKYIIEGKTVITDKPLTDTDIDEIAAGIKRKAAPPAPTAVGSTSQPIPSLDVTGVSEPDPKPPAITSGYLKGLKDPLDAGAQLLPRGLSFLTSAGGIVPNIFSDWLAKEAAKVDKTVKEEEQGYQDYRRQQGNEGFDWGRLAGNVINPTNIAAGVKAAGIVAPSRIVAGGVLGGAAGGALTPVTNITEEDSFAEQKAKQVGGGAAFGGAGASVIKGAGRVISPLIDSAEKKMLDLGVQLTPGMLMGGKTKNFEDFARNLPLLGKYIEDANQRALFSFNKAVINRALKKVNEQLPEDVVGRDAVQYVNKVVSDKYDDVLSKINWKLDFNAYTKLLKTLKANKLPSAEQNTEVNEILKATVYSKIPKGLALSGKAFKDIESDLAQEVSKYKTGITAHDRNIGGVLEKVLKDFKKSLADQNPQQSSVLRRIDSAYGEVALMKQAAANGGAENGVFTPKQYQTAVRQRDISRNKTQFAAGKARGQDISDDALTVVGNTKESNLEGRLAVGAAGGFAVLTRPELAIPAAVALPFLYSEGGIKAITSLMTKRPDIAVKIGDSLTKNAGKFGGISSAQVMKEYNRLIQTEEEKQR